MATTALAKIDPKQLAVVEKKALATATPILNQARGLRITDATTFIQADRILGRIIEARVAVRSEFAPILDPLEEAFRELNKAKRGAQALHKKMDGPLEEAEDTLRADMGVYKTEERRQIQTAEQEKQRKQAEIDRQARAKQEAIDRAKSASMRKRLEAQQEQLEDQAIEIAAAPTPAPVEAAGTRQRVTPRWRVTDMEAVLAGVATGSIPLEAITVNSRYVDGVFKDAPETVAGWVGFEKYDDVSVVRR